MIIIRIKREEREEEGGERVFISFSISGEESERGRERETRGKGNEIAERENVI